MLEPVIRWIRKRGRLHTPGEEWAKCGKTVVGTIEPDEFWQAWCPAIDDVERCDTKAEAKRWVEASFKGFVAGLQMKEARNA